MLTAITLSLLVGTPAGDQSLAVDQFPLTALAQDLVHLGSTGLETVNVWRRTGGSLILTGCRGLCCEFAGPGSKEIDDVAFGPVQIEGDADVTAVDPFPPYE